MSRLRLLIVGVFVSLATAIGVTAFAGAHSYYSGNFVNVAQSGPIDQTVFASGRSVNISADINGDVFCAGQNVSISGNISGDVICAGQTVTLTGDVDGDVRLAGQTVHIASNITGNATVAGQSFELEPAATIGGDTTVWSADAASNGSIARDLSFSGAQATINGTIGRNINATTPQLSLGPEAAINGNIKLVSENEINRSDGAAVTGKITRTEPSRQNNSSAIGNSDFVGFAYAMMFVWLLSLLIFLIVLALVFPGQLTSVTDRAIQNGPWKALLIGFLASFVIPLTIFVLSITVIGLPLALFGGLSWLLILFLSGPVFAFYIGRLVMRQSNTAALTIFVGGVILIVAYLIPILGFLTWLATLYIGTGMILQELYGRYRRSAHRSIETLYNVKPVKSKPSM